MTQQQAIEFLDSRRQFSKEKNPQTIERLMEALGNPQDQLKFIHITGTNGKGSTAKMIACILTAAGCRTGLNISPYVCRFNERMSIDGKEIGAKELGAVVKQVKAAAEGIEAAGYYATEFECTTAAALLWYARKECEFVVLEVGIGGAHDATNVVKNTLVACMLPVSMDHTELLGDTLEKIAREKCGIFKPGCTVVSAPGQPAQVQRMIEASAKKQNLPLRIPQAEDIHLLWSTLRETHVDYGGYEVSLKLAGAHQAANAAVAVETALALCERGYDIGDDAILEGLAAARLPGRIQLLRWDPLLVVDGAHNPAGMAALAAALKAAKVTPVTAIIGMMADKQINECLKALKGCFDCVYTVPADDSPRAMDPDQLAVCASEHFRHVEAKASLAEAVNAAEQTGRGICICGSLYLAGQAEKFFH